MHTASYDWQEKKTCDAYAGTWEISCDEVHYSWLSPGEKTLGLLCDVPPGSPVLDVGCGMGENMMALHALNLVPHGIDISDHMLKRARRTLERHYILGRDAERSRRLLQCDVLDMKAQFAQKFRAILSVYSLEFLATPDDFKRATSNIADALQPGGTFLCSIAHPSTHPDYPLLTNETIPMGKTVPLLLYSIRDVVQALCESGMVIERIIEQKTPNPSQMTYEQALQFPYRFARGKNPFRSLFDDHNNTIPHTLVYKARKQIS